MDSTFVDFTDKPLDLTEAYMANLFDHLSFELPKDGQGRFDCVWCTVAKLAGVSLLQLQFAMPEVNKPMTARKEDDLKHATGTPNDQMELLLTTLGKNVVSGIRARYGVNDVLPTYQIFWDNQHGNISVEMAQQFALLNNVDKIGLSYGIPGEKIGHCVIYQNTSLALNQKNYNPNAWEFVDWQKDPVSGARFTPPANALFYLIFAIMPRAGDDCDRIQILTKDQKSKMLSKTYERRDQFNINRRKGLRDAYLEKKRGDLLRQEFGP